MGGLSPWVRSALRFVGHDCNRAPQTGPHAFFARAASTRSGVYGALGTRTPIALNTALPMAAHVHAEAGARLLPRPALLAGLVHDLAGLDGQVVLVDHQPRRDLVEEGVARRRAGVERRRGDAWRRRAAARRRRTAVGALADAH